MMNVSWVVAHDYTIDLTVDVEMLKGIGPIWGSWTTWRSCATDNVICHSLPKAHELVARNFQQRSNLFVYKDHFAELGRPGNVRLYGGEYHHALDSIDDIISLHLAAATADIVLLLGFKLGKIQSPEDPHAAHLLKNRHGLIRSAVAQNPQTQWVLVDHEPKLDDRYQELPNLSCDKMSNVLKLLTQ